MIEFADLVPNGHLAISFLDLGTGDRWNHHADRVFHAASTMKVAVLVELMRRRDSECLDLHEKIEVRNTFRSIVDGSSFSVDPTEDSAPELFERLGDQASLLELATAMITRSSNLATNLLVERLDAERIRESMSILGCWGVQVLRGVEDSKAYAKGLNNTVTAESLNSLMAALASNVAASAESCGIAIQILTAQQHRDAIPAGLPPDARCANKTGWTSQVNHDTAIVFPPTRAPYVLTVLTESVPEPKKLIAEISRRVYASLAS